MTTELTESASTEQPRSGRAGRWVKRVLIALLVLLLLLIAVVIGFLWYFHIPSNAAGMAAKSVCSAAFVAGREESAETLMDQDVLPASPVLGAISTSIDREQHSVTAKFLGLIERRASLVSKRGCVLDEPPDPTAVPFTQELQSSKPWPAGDQPVPTADLEGVKALELARVVEEAFVGEGDPLAANARGVAVAQNGRMLAIREGKGLAASTPLHGWSMTKTVAAMLFAKKADEVGLSIETPVVDAFPAGREPEWVARWREDDRAQITVADLLFMRDGLAIDESYQPWGSVVQMLYGEPNMAAWAADHPTDHAPGTYWEYLSATSNILAQVTQRQFTDDDAYWDFARTQLFEPIGVRTATLETDTTGTQVGSSYLWASTADWARLGQLLLDDGRWAGRQVLPAGFRELASTPAMPDGEGHGYGAQSWLLGDPTGGECRTVPGVPADTVAMEGHWGQLVAAVPSYDAVVVRLGWTFDSSKFDSCQFLSDVLATLPRR